jgi:SOS response associated peptidase (SRAP)
MARGEHRSRPRATRWQFVDAELYCLNVRARHLQTDLGRNRCAVPADARPAGGEHARPLQRLPHTTIDAILGEDGKRRLERMRWGLIPSWWSKPLKEMKLATFNARAETVATKPMFRSAFKRNRCLIPMSGYYEWQDNPTLIDQIAL